MSCPNCGSWAVKADRSLGGRPVCGRCGIPLGAKVIPLRRGGRRRPRLSLPQGRRPWWLALLVLLAVSGGLAALDDGGRTPWRPRERQPWPERNRI